MKHLVLILPLVSLYGCTEIEAILVEQPPSECQVDPKLAVELGGSFEPIADEALLKAALGAPEKGGLCQGKVYETKERSMSPSTGYGTARSRKVAWVNGGHSSARAGR